MKTATAVLALLVLCAGCGSIVVNENYFEEEDFIRTNEMREVPISPESVDAVLKRLPPGVSIEALASMKPEERTATIEKAVSDAKEAGELPSTTAKGEGSQQGGFGNVIFIINQSGTTTQDVKAQVEAAIRAAGTINSPNGSSDTSGNTGGNTQPGG